MILTDAGPLIALVHEADRHHPVCRETFRSLAEPVVTVWPAFTEAMYLLGFSWQGQDALWQFVEQGVLSFFELGLTDAPRMRVLMKKYQDLPMDLADAALVRVAEREKIERIFTLDRKHFSIYRPEGLSALTLVP